MIMNKQERLENRLQPKIAEFREERQTLVLSTLSEDGFPHISYAPFVRLADGYYILISEIAEHTQNLLVNKNLSFMLLEDEQDAKQIFARHRLTYKACAEVMSRESESWALAIPALEARFGEIVTNLSGLRDFRLLVEGSDRFGPKPGQRYFGRVGVKSKKLWARGSAPRALSPGPAWIMSVHSPDGGGPRNEL